MHSFFKLGFVVLAFCLLTSCNLLTVDESDVQGYPTQFERYSSSELAELSDEFHATNKEYFCSVLNVYGFTGYPYGKEDEDMCENREVVRIEMNYSDTLITSAKKILLSNSKFTGVIDTSALKVKEIMPILGCVNCDGVNSISDKVIIGFKISFFEQIIDSIKVEHTQIDVHVDANGVNRIQGNWFSSSTLPPNHNYSAEEIKNGMVGWEIDMQYHNGSDEVYTITEKDLKQKAVVSYLPVEKENGLMIHKSWVIPVNYNEDEKGWLAYFDVVKGTLLKMKFLNTAN